MQLADELRRGVPIYRYMISDNNYKGFPVQQNIIEQFIADSRRYLGC